MRIVTLSLDEKSYQVWKEFPSGTRSRSIRAILNDALALQQSDQLYDELAKAMNVAQRHIRALEAKIQDLEATQGWNQ